MDSMDAVDAAEHDSMASDLAMGGAHDASAADMASSLTDIISDAASSPQLAVDASVIEEALAAAAAPEVGGLGLLTGTASALLGNTSYAASHLFGPNVLIPFTVGTVSAAVGAGLAKMYVDRIDGAFAKRLTEVRKHACLQAPPTTNLAEAASQFIASFDWCLSIEQARANGMGWGLRAFGYGQLSSKKEEDDDVLSGPFSEAVVQRQLNRQQRRIWKQCREPVLPPREPSTSKATPLSFGRRQSAPDAQKDRGKAKDAYEKLFNPQSNSVTGNRGLCAALCFLVSAFLEHRQRAPGQAPDIDRQSLRLAVVALARHPLFNDLPGEVFAGPRKRGAHGNNEAEGLAFSRSAVVLLCFLDAALSWRPTDPLNLFGKLEAGDGLLIGKETRPCSYAVLATRLRSSLNKAGRGCTKTWHRISCHLDLLRNRELAAPWHSVWVHSQDASILLRNRTRVPLKVELYRTRPAPSPWADWRLIAQLIETVKRMFPAWNEEQPVLAADVGAGIEWAMRPKVREGQQFLMKLMTDAGVVVCSKKLRRGQIFDFEIKVPDRKSSLESSGSHATSSTSVALEPVAETSVVQPTIHAVEAPCPSILSAEADPKDDAASSVGSTAAPASSTTRERRVSFSNVPSIVGIDTGSVGSSSVSAAGPSCIRPVRLEFTSRPRRAPIASVENIVSCICPRCLREMSARTLRPPGNIYVEGVRCDHCSVELVSGRGMAKGMDNFFHCSRCWFDLCHDCGLREMREVWWADED